MRSIIFRILLCGFSMLSLGYEAGAGTAAVAYKNATTLKMMEFNFDDAYYLRMNPLVQLEVDAGIWSSGFQHYLNKGAALGYAPRADFNEAAYLSRYPDVANKVQSKLLLSGFEHWASVGKYQNFAISPAYETARSSLVSTFKAPTKVNGPLHFTYAGASTTTTYVAPVTTPTPTPTPTPYPVATATPWPTPTPTPVPTTYGVWASVSTCTTNCPTTACTTNSGACSPVGKQCTYTVSIFGSISKLLYQCK